MPCQFPDHFVCMHACMVMAEKGLMQLSLNKPFCRSIQTPRFWESLISTMRKISPYIIIAS